MIINTLVAMTAGFLLSFFFGTPKIISARTYIEKLCRHLAPTISSKYQETEDGQHNAGMVYITVLMLILLVPTALILILLYIFLPALGIIVDALLCWSLLDIKNLVTLSKDASRAAKTSNSRRADKRLNRLFGRKYKELSGEEIVKASIQGIADRTVDSIAAPLLYMFLLSSVGGLFFAAADAAANLNYGSEENSLSFAEPVRVLQNGLCFLPGKLAAYLMLADALWLKLNTRAAERVYKKDSKKCARPCFGGCRAVMAGLLGISLMPEEVYSEQFMRTVTIGEQLKEPEHSDLNTARTLMIGTAAILLIMLFMVKLTIGVWV
ncbi:MAG: cobalamin biosynthesis protein [Ruminococcus sp.]|nr:cobalamin biosynthesis protein [Ruminococcus sp.]